MKLGVRVSWMTDKLFDKYNFAAIMKELTFALTNQQTGFDPETGESKIKPEAKHFFAAQEQTVKLRNHLIGAHERNRKEMQQKKKPEMDIPLYHFGMIAYERIVEQGQPARKVLDISRGKLIKLARKRRDDEEAINIES